MASRSVNKVILVGNLTRDPELRYTPQGTAVASFVVATNREWKLENGETKQVADFHSCVAWNKLAEICSNLLKKGSKVYIEGRLQTRDWQDQDGQKKYKTEVVAEDMILLRQSGASDYSEGSESPSREMSSDETSKNEETPEVNTDEINLDELDLDAILEE